MEKQFQLMFPARYIDGKFQVNNLHILIMVTIGLLSGCGQYSLRNIDQPPPEDYELWEKDKQSILQIKKALLECGAIAPSTVGWPYREAYRKLGISTYDEQMNSYFMTNKCMENAGYKRKSGRFAQEDCNDPSFPERRKYPACKPEAIVPSLNVRRRLNSWYCKVKSNYEYCLSHALAPKLCNPKQVQNPPPECLPPHQEYDTAVPISPMQNRVTQPYEPIRDYPERSIQLQQETQRENNRQMNELLRDIN